MASTSRYFYVLEILLLYIFSFQRHVVGETCRGYLYNVYITESCSVGGCCVPSDGKGDTLCCIPTLTIILVSVFIGGTIFIIITVIACCAICRYRNRQKIRRRLEERRRRQRERDQERHQRLMTDPFANGDPFITSVETATAQPPHYHGQPVNATQPAHLNGPPGESVPPVNVPTLQPRVVRVPPPYPNTPPPAYYSRIGTRHENRVPSRLTNSRATSRAPSNQSRGATTRAASQSDIHPELSLANGVLHTEVPSHVTNGDITSRTSTHMSGTTENTNHQANNERSILTVEDLEEQERDDMVGNITDIKAESRMSVKPESRRSTKVESRRSTKIESRISTKADLHQIETDRQSVISELSLTESRMSNKIMYPILENETPMLQIDTRGRFIKSSMSAVSEAPISPRKSSMYAVSEAPISPRKSSMSVVSDGPISSRTNSSGRNYVRSVEAHELIVNNLDFV